MLRKTLPFVFMILTVTNSVAMANNEQHVINFIHKFMATQLEENKDNHQDSVVIRDFVSPSYLKSHGFSPNELKLNSYRVDNYKILDISGEYAHVEIENATCNRAGNCNLDNVIKIQIEYDTNAKRYYLLPTKEPEDSKYHNKSYLTVWITSYYGVHIQETRIAESIYSMKRNKANEKFVNMFLDQSKDDSNNALPWIRTDYLKQNGNAQGWRLSYTTGDDYRIVTSFDSFVDVLFNERYCAVRDCEPYVLRFKVDSKSQRRIVPSDWKSSKYITQFWEKISGEYIDPYKLAESNKI